MGVKTLVGGLILGTLVIRPGSPPEADGAGAGGPPQADAVAVLDGRAIVSEADIRDYQALQACYGEEALPSRRAALMRLVEAAIAESAMRDHDGPRITDKDVEADALRIDRETRAPEILACIKKHFGGDKRRYERVFVRPALVEARFRHFVPNDPGIQAGARRRIGLAAERGGKGEGLEALARQFGLAYSSATYALAASSAAAVPPEAARGGPPPAYQTEFISRHLQGLKPGQLRGPEETDHDFRLVRLIRAVGPRWTFESVSAPKTTQEDWLRSLPRMKLTISDEELRLWVRGIRGNPRLAAVEVLPASSRE